MQNHENTRKINGFDAWKISKLFQGVVRAEARKPLLLLALHNIEYLTAPGSVVLQCNYNTLNYFENFI
ncbi:MAG: hypothetical protein HLUCCA04_02935 [Oceanicaulis sp. HLUCCA04]|nr:MAG: hypothetical protein HLUCCA04_02935 [Oceanicaulis sp. HLUCCA04]